MPPKRGRGGATKRGAKSASVDAPPTKLKRQDSANTELKKAIAKIKSSDAKKVKKIKPDSDFLLTRGYKTTIHEDYACMLNQTNIGQNNNKFYVIQVGKIGKMYGCFTKWGRVGELGSNACDEYKTAAEAIKHFEKKFKDKTKNDWSNRDNFQPKPGKYTLIEMDDDSSEDDYDYDDGNAEVKSIANTNFTDSSVKCNLDIRTQVFLKLIFSEDMFESQMSSMNLNVNKMPLGKISKTQIAKGLEVLIELEESIKKKKKDCSELTSKFYTLIPHEFGRTKPPLLYTIDDVNKKKEMMMTLSDIELTQSIQKQVKSNSSKHPLDARYEMLNAELTLLDKKSEEFKLLLKYATCCPNTRQGPLLDAWRIDREGEDVRFAQHEDIKHRKLLWHGTSVAVVAAIIKAGLRIMPHSGGCVGKGIYFASQHSKSSWYVGCHNGKFEGEKNVGFMFLAEVALGKMKFIKQCADYKKAPVGYDSVVARGMEEPDSKKDVTRKYEKHNVEIPVGKPIPQKEFKDSVFSESEYLVYKESQARLRYVLKFSFE